MTSVLRDDGLVHDPQTDWTFGARCEQHFDITEGDPESARITIAWTWRFRRDSIGLRCHGRNAFIVVMYRR